MNEVVVFDVGHGNCAVIHHDDQTVVVDAPLRDHLLDALRQEGTTEVRLAIASHSDSDHSAGLIGLLLDPDIQVHEVRINPDATRQTKAASAVFWGDLKTALKRAREMHGTRLRTELTDATTGDLSSGQLLLEVVCPPASLALGGVGSVGDRGKTVTANAMSAVIRVVLEGVPLVLLTGDLEREGLDYLLAEGVDLTSRVLVFPHHGGIPEGATSPEKMISFAKDLINACQPETVIFSIGRGLHATPRPELVTAIRREFSEVHIGCTQLSERCSDEVLGNGSYLGARYAAGRPTASCCLGTAVLLANVGLSSPVRVDHQAAISSLPGRLCR